MLELLGDLEREESRLLSWGVVEASFTEDELLDKVSEHLDQTEAWSMFDDSLDFINAMVDQGLLFRWDESDEYRFRTRMAETVRLMSGLKQLFPKHLEKTGAWLSAPSLVSDFRFICRPREYPKRDQNTENWVQQWTDGSVKLSSLQASIVKSLLTGEDGELFKLGGFQVRATTRILTELMEEKSSGTMVCAGTGSGKTLAFYLPALIHIADSISRDSSAWVRALAIYPRNELLKDQASETLSQARKMRDTLGEAGCRRGVKVGAYFGDTPKHADYNLNVKKWKSAPGGNICPFLVCPVSGCGSPLIWKTEDKDRRIEQLHCSSCSGIVSSDEIVLTRHSIMKNPPDILFTTTEMMNQRMTDSKCGHIFGIGVSPEKRPAMLLLDEAHTYSGSHGAQVAYLLRRWRYRSKATPHFVGLSATLMEASSFFAQLTGLNESFVQEVSPESEELKQSGMEYQLALRGDPVSGTSLLSTTIQAGMLLRRSLDSRNGRDSRGAYGQKVFLFTDNLDVNNRMFHTLLDAEGQNSWGQPDLNRHPEGSLANLRSSRLQDETRRFSQAQSWRMAEELGHDLTTDTYLEIARVSSQDDGVNAGADIIVATASLEVGFNDPGVGAVMQHKAPHDPASFLQRKGRAGRKLEMRPWTVVVLSDFGRDRLAYQGYDLLFDPELRARDLPLANRHVLKMQSVYAFMDWLSFELPKDEARHLWSDIASPANGEQNDGARKSKRIRQRAMGEMIGEVLKFSDAYYRLSNWLESSLKISAEEVEFLLWDSPRALMTSVLPTLIRRLESQWLRKEDPHSESYHFWKPLPEFIPASLFNGLSLPEVNIRAAMNAGGTNIEEFAMGVNHALREFAPGRISRRFGIDYGGSKHWIPLDPEGEAVQQVNILDYCKREELEDVGAFAYAGIAGVENIRVLRPYVLRPRHDVHRSIKDSSNAFPNWHSQILPPFDADSGVCIDLPRQSKWKDILHEMRFYMHRDYTPARIRRFTTGSNANLLVDGGESIEIESTFSLKEEGAEELETVALGFAFEADALRVLVTLPDQWHFEGSGSGDKLPSLRAARFRHCIKEDASLDGVANIFQRGWIAEVSLSAVIATAVSEVADLESAWAKVRGGLGDVTMPNVLSDIFQTLDLEEERSGGSQPSRLDEIRDILADSQVIACIDDHISVLWETTYDTWQEWLCERYMATLGAAFREAIQQMCPDVDAESLLLDIDQGPRDEGECVHGDEVKALWISEPDPGGGGIIEKLLPRIAEEPGRFLDLARCALAESDFELADKELTRFLALVVDSNEDHPEILTALANVRQSDKVVEITNSYQDLQENMLQSGFQISHVVIAALNSRVLRPGSNSDTDRWSRDIHCKWKDEEQRIGVEIDARSFAYAVSLSDAFDQALGRTLQLSPGQNRRTWRFNAIYGMLWPRGAQARNSELSIWNAFVQMPEPERLLVLDVLDDQEKIVHLASEGWRESFETNIIESGRVLISAPPTDIKQLKKELISLLVTPVDTGFMLLFPRIRGVRRNGIDWVVEMELVVTGDVEIPSEIDVATDRLIVKSSKGNRDEVRDLLESLFVTELMDPSSDFWLVSPWVSDVPIIDNRAGGYAGLEPSWAKKRITLAEILACNLKRNPEMKLRVITRPPEYASSRNFISRLKTLVELNGQTSSLYIDAQRERLHTKGLATPSFAWIGSMNFTNNGIEVLDETIKVETKAEITAKFLISMTDSYLNQ